MLISYQIQFTIRDSIFLQICFHINVIQSLTKCNSVISHLFSKRLCFELMNELSMNPSGWQTTAKVGSFPVSKLELEFRFGLWNSILNTKQRCLKNNLLYSKIKSSWNNIQIILFSNYACLLTTQYKIWFCIQKFSLKKMTFKFDF